MGARKAVVIALAATVVLTSGCSRSSRDSIEASGTIEAREIDLSVKVAGRIIQLNVDEGDEVRPGEVIAVLEGEELKAQVVQAEGLYESAKARLADLERGSREEQIRQARAALAQAEASSAGALQNLVTAREAYRKSTELKARYVAAESAYESAKNAYQLAKAKLTEVEAGARPEQIAQARAAVDQARAQSDNAKNEAERAQKLFESGAISSQQLDAALAKRDASTAALAAAEARLEEILAGARSEELAQARAAEAQAKSQLEGARMTFETMKELYDDRLQLKQQLDTAQTLYQTAREQVNALRAQLDLLIAGPTKQTLEAAQAQVKQAKAALEAARAAASNLVIRAPTAGTVTLKIAELGETVIPGMPIVRIADLDSVWVKVYVPLPKLRVKVGDIANVTTDAYPHKKYCGRVVEIAEKPEFTPKNVQTKEERVKLVFGVKIELENPKRELKPGMPADAVILLNH